MAGLEGAVYEVRAAEDISTPDGTLRYSKGEVVDTITTSSDGFVKSKELYLGKYEVKEITAPYGMVVSGETHTVELTYAGQNISVTVDGYTDFIFVNRFGQPQHQATLNKAIRRIIRNCNDKQFLENDNPEVLLPHFSCHSLRHTFTTRMCEAGVNVKVIQDALGHKDVSTTLNIYTDVTKELRKSEFEGLELQFNQ